MRYRIALAALVVLLACGSLQSDLIFRPAAAGGGPTCGTGDLIAEDFDGATTSAANCGPGSATSDDDVAWDSCDDAAGGDVDLDADVMSGDMFTGEELHADVDSSWDKGAALVDWGTAQEAVGYIFFHADALGPDDDGDDQRIYRFKAAGGAVLCNVKIERNSGTVAFNFDYGNNQLDTAPIAANTSYVIEVHTHQDGATDDCDWRIWTCSGDDVSTCGASPTTSQTHQGSYFTQTPDVVEVGQMQGENHPGANIYIGEVHVQRRVVGRHVGVFPKFGRRKQH